MQKQLKRAAVVRLFMTFAVNCPPRYIVQTLGIREIPNVKFKANKPFALHIANTFPIHKVFQKINVCAIGTF